MVDMPNLVDAFKCPAWGAARQPTEHRRACSNIFRGRRELLDHILVSHALV
jgi:hypothetical protein